MIGMLNLLIKWSDLKFLFELDLRGDPETLGLHINNDKDPGPGGKTIEPIETINDFPQDTIKLDIHTVISNTGSLNKVTGADANGAPK